jgi:hypothetical protein
VKYKTGDEVVLKVEEDFGYKDKTYRSVKVLVLGYSLDSDSDEIDYLCYVPQYEILQGTFKIGSWHVKRHGCEKKFVGEQGVFITASTPIFKHVPGIPGEKCERCEEFFPHVVKPEGSLTFRCRACRENPWR